MSPEVLYLQLESTLRTTVGTLKRHVLEEVSGTVGFIGLGS